MDNLCTIVMYHYVRDLSRTRFPDINARLTSEFAEQVRYMERFYEFVTVEQVRAAIRGELTLPNNAALLTFDDGYRDHYTDVFPILDEMGIQGCFFPPGRAVLENRVLDVNKIHFILASSRVEDLLERVFDLLDAHRDEYDLKSTDALWEEWAEPNRFDPEEVIFIKRIFQRGLPRRARSRLLEILFDEYVGEDEQAFAHQLYMTPEQLECMLRHGMYVGSHSYEHFWLDSLTPDRQRHQVEKSLDFLSQLGAPTDDWVMCYPFGAYDDSVLQILRNKDCGLGVTATPELAELNPENALVLGRLDTNDLPVRSGADPNKWTRRVTN